MCEDIYRIVAITQLQLSDLPDTGGLNEPLC